MEELTGKFGGVTSFLRAPGEGLWPTGDDIEQDDIAVIEVMTESMDPTYWEDLRQRLERELSQKEIVVRSHETRRF